MTASTQFPHNGSITWMRDLEGQRARAYRNLHTEGLYSIKTQEDGDWRVALHTGIVVLRDARFHVGEAGRLRVIETGRKNVHAWVEGAIVSIEGHCPNVLGMRLVTYDPRKYDRFVDADSQMPVKEARYAYLLKNGEVRVSDALVLDPAPGIVYRGGPWE
jgi:hypothetical protein